MFTLPEFSNSKIINWNFHLTDNDDLGYDMILRDKLYKPLLKYEYIFMVNWEHGKQNQ